MTTTRLATMAVAAAMLSGVLAGCAHGAPVAVATTEPTTTATTTAAPAAPTPTPATATVTVPAVGGTVPADQVAAVRAAGGHVYVSPNGTGDGQVVDLAAPLPPVAIADAHAASPDTPWPADGKAFAAAANAQKALVTAYQDAGLNAFLVMRYPANIRDGQIDGTIYTMGAVNVPVDHTQIAPHGPTAAAALTAAKGWFAAFPNVPIITFDGVQR